MSEVKKIAQDFIDVRSCDCPVYILAKDYMKLRAQLAAAKELADGICRSNGHQPGHFLKYCGTCSYLEKYHSKDEAK